VAKSDLLERPTKEQIAVLPPFAGLSLKQIVLLRSPAQLEDAYRAIEREKFVGFDTETKPTFTKGAEATGPHVVQFALRNRAFIVQIGKEPPVLFLKSVIESHEIVKVGFGLKSDRAPLFRRLGIKVGAAVELTGTLRVLRYKQALGAKAAVAIVLGQRLQKSKSVTTSNWAAPVLKPNQLLYAANDAYAALCVFRALGSPYTPSGSPTPNPSIERTCQGPLHDPCPAAHVER
jgi:ribonuclease D